MDTPQSREPRPLANRNEGLSVRQAAEKSGFHYQTIYGWIKAGELPVTRFGPNRGIIRIHPDDLADVAGPQT